MTGSWRFPLVAVIAVMLLILGFALLERVVAPQGNVTTKGDELEEAYKEVSGRLDPTRQAQAYLIAERNCSDGNLDTSEEATRSCYEAAFVDLSKYLAGCPPGTRMAEDYSCPPESFSRDKSSQA